MTDADLHERVAALEAAEALRNLVADYAVAVDTCDIEAVERVFAPDAVMSAPGRRWEGIDAIKGFLGGDFAANPVARRHFVTNVRITDADAHSAAATSYFLYTTASAGTSILGWGTYTDRARRVDGAWRLVGKDIVVAHSGPMEDGWAHTLAAEIAARR